MTRPTYHNGPRPQLTDADLHAIGAVIVQWTVAEHCLRDAQSALFQHPAVAATKWPEQRLVRLKDKLDAWRKTLALACPNHPEHHELGRFLADRCRALEPDQEVVESAESVVIR